MRVGWDFSLEEWRHVAVVFEEGGTFLYVDGSLKEERMSSTTAPPPDGEWSLRMHPLFGPYHERIVHRRGTCRDCGAFIDGLCLERKRGGTAWLACQGGCKPQIPPKKPKKA